MIEIRFHGRGGQGAVVASKILAVAAVHEGYCVQAFPTFGVERRGAPVAAFTRIDRQPIRLRTSIYHPHHVIVLDPSLIGQIDPTQGMEGAGWVVLNAAGAASPDGRFNGRNVALINAAEVAVRHGLGTRTSPIVNTAILGAMLSVSRILRLDSLEAAIAKSVPDKVSQNVAAARDAWREVSVVGSESRN